MPASGAFSWRNSARPFQARTCSSPRPIFAAPLRNCSDWLPGAEPPPGVCEGAHLDTATTAQDVAQGPDREPSSARSAFNCAGSVESVYARHCVRGRCEPRTGRLAVRWQCQDAPPTLVRAIRYFIEIL